MTEYRLSFAYRPGKTVIHRLPAALKLALMMILTVTLFSLSPEWLAGLTGLLGILCLAARMPVQTHIRNAQILLFFALTIFFFRFVGHPLNRETWISGGIAAVRYLWQLFLVLTSGSLFYETTSALEIRHTLSGIQSTITKPLKKLFPGHDFVDIAFLLSLTITFIPEIFKTWSLLCRSWDARGGNRHRGIFAAYRRITILIPLLLAKLLALAADTERAIRNRSA